MGAGPQPKRLIAGSVPQEMKAALGICTKRKAPYQEIWVKDPTAQHARWMVR